MLRRYVIADGKLVENGAEDAPVLVYANPDEAERKHLVETLQIDEHTLHSALDPDELARMEFEADHLAIIFKRPRNYSSADNFLFKVWSYGLFLFPNRLVVVQAEDIPLFDTRHFSKIKAPLDVALRLLNRTINHFIDHLKGINMIAGELEQKINVSMENRYLLNMFTLEKSLVYYLYGINSNGIVIDKLKSNAAKVGFTPENVEFVDDLIVENNQCYRQAEILSGILSSLMDARASIVSNNLNVMMKNLNSIVIAVAVPSFFAGVGGMSEFSMMTRSDNWVFAYPIFVLAMVGLGVGTFFVTRWLERHWK
jgi:magnesium transporter